VLNALLVKWEKKWGQEYTGFFGTWLKTQSVMKHFYKTWDKLLFKYMGPGKSDFPYPSELRLTL